MATEGASTMASSSASESSEKSEAIKKATELTAQGKRNMVCGEVPKAVNFYEEAVQLLVKACGELSRDCADAYFNCGSALLELGRMETSVLGAALDGVDVEEEKEEEANEQFEKPLENDSLERQELRKEVYEAMAEGEREEELKKTEAKPGQLLVTQGETPLGDETEMDNTSTDTSCEGSKQKTVDNDKSVNDKDLSHEGMEDEQSTVTAAASKEGREESRSLKPEDENSNVVDNQIDKADGASKECSVDKKLSSGDGESVDGKSKELTTGHGPEIEIAKTTGESKESSDLTDAAKDATGEVGEDADAEEEEEEENTAEDKESQEAEVEGEDKEEDVPNFQLSWEYLDLAKVIYLKSDAVEDQLKAAECYIKLGELSMETEQHATAAEDLEQALKIQQKFLSVDDRLIAETHYQLGLAYGLGKEFELSIKHYTQAIEVIEAKIASLSKLVEAAKDDKDKPESEQVKKYQDEIKELQELIPEMRNKIEDSKEEAKDMEKMKDMAKEILGFSGSSKKFDSPTKKSEPSASDRTIDVDENGQRKATDIAHLVRKKRKPDNDDLHVPNGQQTKKVRQDDSSTEVSTADTNTSSGMDVSGSDDKLNTEQNTSEKAAAEPVAF
ncbi:hypothetical protein BsWGS_03151 [Bradybaena similaris]